MPLNVPDYHKSLEKLHVGCEEPRAYFIPYENTEKAKTDNRASSAYVKSLCGTWDFQYYSSVTDVPDFTADWFDRAGMDKLLQGIERMMGHSRHHVTVTLPYSMGGMVETLHNNAQVLNVDYTAQGISVETIVDPILYGRLKEYITKEN